MGRTIDKLSERKIKGHLKPGRHSDGGGLYLSVSHNDARSWVFMWKIAARRREMGLGSLNAVPLAKARQLAREAREAVAGGRDPIATRSAPSSKTFGKAAEELIASMESGWRNPKHRSQWRNTLRDYCTALSVMDVATIDTEAVLSCLRPIWKAKAETASRVRGRIEKVLDYAKAHGWRQGENPARWRGHLAAILPARAKLTRGHHKAMAYTALPGFLVRLREQPGISARALELAILTAARSGEVLGMTWTEFNLNNAVWTVPAERMKGGLEHRVPLSDRAVTILREMERFRVSEYVFPGMKRGKPLSNMAMAMMLRDMKVDATVHGFRSAFRDWAAESTSFPNEVCEAALAHVIENKAEAAYRRGDMLDRRRKLMEAWAAYLEPREGNVLVLPRVRP